MKTATLPALRVAPALRAEAESVLLEGETISSFLEASLRANIAQRLAQQAFIERGMLSRQEAKNTQEYYSADAVISSLQHILKSHQ